ncbi:hypothetical protein KUCAC02_008322, partial [Chaenocephalus aceratus]
VACKENPFDRKPGIPQSKTFQTLQSARAPAPGHGFPLIKRKVQTDQNASSADLQLEMSDLDKHLEDLEQRGVELERNLRDNKNEEDQMLMEWFSLNHERHVLVRRGTELFYLTKQQKLEESQADVSTRSGVSLTNQRVTGISRKEGLKELKKSKGKFKPAKIFKMLNHKAESNKDSVDKKS